MVYLKDIAGELGVSVSLVSKVLNDRLGNTGIRPELITQIRDKATQMGYRPNSSAVAFRKGRHDVIGVLIHRQGTPGSGLVEALLAGITAVTRKLGLRQSIGFFEPGPELERMCADIHRGAMDGLIVTGIHDKATSEAVFRFHRAGMPMVTVFEEALHCDVPNVGMSQAKVTRLTTQHLIEQGCTRIAHIANIQLRLEGYQQALDRAGLPVIPELVFRSSPLDFGYHVGEQAVIAFQEAGVAFDGLIAQADQEAMGAMNELVRQGMRIPEDVRIAGVDNAPYCEFAQVPLTSVSQCFEERGAKAVDMLVQLIDGNSVESMDFEPLLVPRASTA